MEKIIKGKIIEIVNCPHIKEYYNNKNKEDNCYNIINSQHENDINNFQLPEPWSGEIDKAKILVISSSPYIDLTKKEVFPTYQWENEEITNFFINRCEKYLMDGVRYLRKDGTYSADLLYNSQIKDRIKEITGREPIPGKDYCWTAIVHCNSEKEQGVNQAIKNCSGYFKSILSLSSALLLVVVGSPAKRLLCKLYELGKNTGKLYGPVIIEGKPRKILFLPHPNAHRERILEKYLGESKYKELKDYVRNP